MSAQYESAYLLFSTFPFYLLKQEEEEMPKRKKLEGGDTSAEEIASLRARVEGLEVHMCLVYVGLRGMNVMFLVCGYRMK
jgi:hypothetical protein